MTERQLINKHIKKQNNNINRNCKNNITKYAAYAFLPFLALLPCYAPTSTPYNTVLSQEQAQRYEEAVIEQYRVLNATTRYSINKSDKESLPQPFCFCGNKLCIAPGARMSDALNSLMSMPKDVQYDQRRYVIDGTYALILAVLSGIRAVVDSDLIFDRMITSYYSDGVLYDYQNGLNKERLIIAFDDVASVGFMLWKQNGKLLHQNIRQKVDSKIFDECVQTWVEVSRITNMILNFGIVKFLSNHFSMNAYFRTQDEKCIGYTPHREDGAVLSFDQEVYEFCKLMQQDPVIENYVANIAAGNIGLAEYFLILSLTKGNEHSAKIAEQYLSSFVYDRHLALLGFTSSPCDEFLVFHVGMGVMLNIGDVAAANAVVINLMQNIKYGDLDVAAQTIKESGMSGAYEPNFVRILDYIKRAASPDAKE